MAAGDVIGSVHRLADRSSSVPGGRADTPSACAPERRLPSLAERPPRPSERAARRRAAGAGRSSRRPRRSSAAPAAGRPGARRRGPPGGGAGRRTGPVLPLRPTRWPAPSTSPAATSRARQVAVRPGHVGPRHVDDRQPDAAGTAPIVVHVAHRAAPPRDHGRACRHQDVERRVVVVRRQPLRSLDARRAAAPPPVRPASRRPARRSPRRHRRRRLRRSRAGRRPRPAGRCAVRRHQPRPGDDRPSSGVGST